jgi:outer membrane protein TolC
VARTILIVAVSLAALALAGCTPEAYRRSADAQVYGMLAKRKKAVLDYQPDTAVQTPSDVTVPKQAYATIPTTPVPPPARPPVRTTDPVELRYGPLGPDKKWVGLPVPEGAVQPASSSTATTNPELDSTASNPFLYGPPSPHQPANRLDLFRCIEYGVQHSRRYQDQTEALYGAALDVTLERHLLSPRPFATVGANYTGGQGDVDYRSAVAVTGNAGVRQRLPYGGEVVAQALVQFVNALSDSAESGEPASVALSGSLPLLRGAGLINLEPLIGAERELVYQVRAFEDFRRQFAVDISRSYFNTLARQQAVRNRQLNYENLAVLTERTRALFAAGKISFLEVQRAEQAQLQAENSVIAAREAYQNSLDTFKITLGMPVSEELAIIPVALELDMPDIEGPDVLEAAHRYRLDLQTARDRIDDARRGVDNARNGLLPGLDLTAQAQAANREDDPARKLDSRTLTYSAGVTLDLPIDRLSERNVYRRSLIAFERTQRAFEELRDRVTADVQQDVRSVRTAESSLRIQQESISLAERRLDLASELLRQSGAGGAGRAAGNTPRPDARDLVEAQNDLLQAQDTYEQARADLQIQVLQFLRDTGTLRLDPSAGLIGSAMNVRQSGKAVDPADPDKRRNGWTRPPEVPVKAGPAIEIGAARPRNDNEAAGVE